MERLRERRTGYFFDVITRGFGMMPSYRAQVPVEDRWAIIAYIRALQLSQNAQPRRRAGGGARRAAIDRRRSALDGDDGSSFGPRAPRPSAPQAGPRALLVGLVAIAICGLWAIFDPQQALRSYLIGYLSGSASRSARWRSS